MVINQSAWQELQQECNASGATLVAVSKTQPIEAIEALYSYGQRDFGENYVQELLQKKDLLPSDIRWHFIGHLQTNKVKFLAPFVYRIHGVDSLRLWQAIDRQAALASRAIGCLLQVHIAREETKFGLSPEELIDALDATNNGQTLPNAPLCGLMGMASLTEEAQQVRDEFRNLHRLFLELKASRFANCTHFDTLSMGMSGDYRMAISEGSTLVRIGSRLFGPRQR